MVPELLEGERLYREYRQRCQEDLLPRAVAACAWIFLVLQTVIFIPADWIFFRDKFWLFLPARLVMNVVLGIVYFWGARRHPLTSLIVGCLGGGVIFLGMVTVTGGSESSYYAGMILLAIGLGVLLPISGRQCLSIGSMLFVGYAALPFYTTDPIVWSVFAQKLFFLGAAVLEGAYACHHVDKLRFADYAQRHELERARDELRDLDRAKARFSANVHHELRTPLTLILAPLDTLRSGDRGAISGPVRETLDVMYANGRRLLKMINNLLDLAKVESRQFDIHRVSIRPGRLVEELVVGAGPLAERRGVALSMSGFDSLPEIHVDPSALEKVVFNLLGNALKFTDEGDSITLLGEPAEAGVRITVRDSGAGIPRDKLGLIFDRFAQVDSSATRKHEGTGIGLSLAKELVELHGGRIWAESEGEGHGTDVIFELPFGEPDGESEEAVLVDDQGDTLDLQHSRAAIATDLTDKHNGRTLAESASDAEGSQAAADPHGLQRPDAPSVPDDAPLIVIAEDNPDMRSLLSFLLGKEYRVRAAVNGREALDLVREEEPALVLSDVMMPELSGIDLCREIKGDPQLEALPVVLVTSKAESEMQIEGLEEGADDYVTKPFHPRELMARVRSLVAKRELQRALADRNGDLEQALNDLRGAEVRLVQAERLSAVGELAAGLAHEINNPVNFAVNAARAMEGPVEDLVRIADKAWSLASSSGGDPESARRDLAAEIEACGLDETKSAIEELVGIVIQGLERTHRIVGDLRDFAAPGRGGSVPVDIRKGLRSTVELLKHYLGDHGVRVEMALPDALPPVSGDPGALNQVYLNLIKNAAEAMGEPGGTVQIEARMEGPTLKIRFEDNGPGMTDEVKSRLFEPLYSTKDEGKGTGLGLSITRQIAQSHGGELEVESEPGEGCIFTLTLPCDSGREAADAT
jgi:signal transduction histidine kinase